MTQTVPCRACWKEVDLSDNYCRHCGKGLGRHIPFYYGHAGIIVLTFCALGPFSLFLVWRSPVLSKSAKWAYTAAILAFTGWTLLAAYRIYTLLMGQFRALGLL